MDYLATAGSSYTQAQRFATETARDSGAAHLKKVADAAEAFRPLFDKVDADLKVALQQQQFSLPLQPMVMSLLKVRGACETFLRSLAAGQ